MLAAETLGIESIRFTSPAIGKRINETFNTMTLTIYHNPRCRKSRSPAILRRKWTQPKIIDYQKTRLSENEIQLVLNQLNYTAED